MNINTPQPEIRPGNIEIPLANACAALLTKDMARALNILPVEKDRGGRFKHLPVSPAGTLWAQFCGLTACGLVLREGHVFRLSSAGALVREAIEEFGPGEEAEPAALLVDAALPNLSERDRERAVTMAEALLVTAGREALEGLLSRAV